MNRYLFHSKAVDIFRKKVYSNILTIYDVKSDEKQISVFVDGEKTNIQGFEFRDQETRKTFFVQSQHMNELPFKVLETETQVYARKVYHLVKRIKPGKPIVSDEMSVKEWIDSWFDLEHTSKEDLMVAKFLVASSATSRTFTRICTGAGFGKDGIVNNLIGITGKGKNVNTASPAKLFQLIGEGFTAFNEIAGFGGERKETMQNFFLVTGDSGATVYEHGTTGSDKTKSNADISEYGWTILHNLPEYYMNKGQLTFEQMFSHAVFDRVFPVLLEGGVKPKNDFMKVNIDFDRLVDDSLGEYKRWIGRYFHLKSILYKTKCRFVLKEYDLSVPGRKESGSRFWNNFNNIAVLVSLYAETQEEFDHWMDIIYDRHKKYITKVEELGLLA